ncbi:hypothetical protein pah_c197o122 [Parachlamydia acanthamoebae str. Hall's coccus]|nr:hypothetical protein pah_c197o122 [Parachlamydia acanthamoebae str. Hall's coccus]
MGFLAEYEGLQLIHFWELSRKASMPHMRIAHSSFMLLKSRWNYIPT